MLITDEFLNWLHTAKGSELMKYKAKNDAEKRCIEIEIDKRLDKNVPVILDNVASFFANIMNEEKQGSE